MFLIPGVRATCPRYYWSLSLFRFGREFSAEIVRIAGLSGVSGLGGSFLLSFHFSHFTFSSYMLSIYSRHSPHSRQINKRCWYVRVYNDEFLGGVCRECRELTSRPQVASDAIPVTKVIRPPRRTIPAASILTTRQSVSPATLTARAALRDMKYEGTQRRSSVTGTPDASHRPTADRRPANALQSPCTTTTAAGSPAHGPSP